MPRTRWWLTWSRESRRPRLSRSARPAALPSAAPRGTTATRRPDRDPAISVLLSCGHVFASRPLPIPVRTCPKHRPRRGRAGALRPPRQDLGPGSGGTEPRQDLGPWMPDSSRLNVAREDRRRSGSRSPIRPPRRGQRPIMPRRPPGVAGHDLLPADRPRHHDLRALEARPGQGVYQEVLGVGRSAGPPRSHHRPVR